MENFELYNPTRIVFGRGQRSRAGELAAASGKKVLLHYGSGSIRASGLYDQLVRSLEEAGVPWVELGGVRPNPRLSLVKEGIALCRKEGVGLILAAGGGSVIDSAKAIAAGACYDGDVWDFYCGRVRPERMLDVGVVLTIPAAGSESSDGTVITNEEGPEKRSFCSPFCYPKFAILDPELCVTLPKKQIAAGGADILAHIMERYFSRTRGNGLSDQLCEGAMRNLIAYLPKVLADSQNLDAWEQVMWTGNVAHNGLLGKGNAEDWASHEIEHQLSALYDIAHGAGLAIIFPAWMDYAKEDHPEKLARFAREVFGVDSSLSEKAAAEEGVRRLREFFASLGLAVRLRDAGIDDGQFEVMARMACKNGGLGSYQRLGAEDVCRIYRLAY